MFPKIEHKISWDPHLYTTIKSTAPAADKDLGSSSDPLLLLLTSSVFVWLYSLSAFVLCNQKGHINKQHCRNCDLVVNINCDESPNSHKTASEKPACFSSHESWPPTWKDHGLLPISIWKTRSRQLCFPADTALVQEKLLADQQLLGVYHTKNTFIFWHGIALLKYQRPWLIKWDDGTEWFDDKI